MEKIWHIKKEDLNKLDCDSYERKYIAGWTTHQMRTRGFEALSALARNKSLRSPSGENSFSEGTTQAIKRKIRATSIQRVPDGELTTQYDKNSIEQVQCEYIFKNKVLRSECSNKDMLKNLWRTFDAGHDYGYAAVLTEFEKDVDGDSVIKYKLIHWNNVIPEPDCDFIEESNWYIIRDWVSHAALETLVTSLTKDGSVKDSTYDDTTVKYLLENHITSGIDPRSRQARDIEKGVTPIDSIEIRTIYCRGADEFVSYIPSLNCVFRRVKNYDPRKDIPVHFYIPEPNPEFPYGAPSAIWTMGFQQAADTSLFSYLKQMELALRPPRMFYGNLKKGEYSYLPDAAWMLGSNPNNKIEPLKIETSTMLQFGQISENISGHMLRNMNLTDGTIASDDNLNYSGTAPGVEMQQRDKTVTINQYQKRMEIFFGEWSNHALRSYLNAHTGEHWMTVDEDTRRRIWDIEMTNAPEDPYEEMPPSIIDGNKIKIDFAELSVDRLSFNVRTGSLVEDEKEKKLRGLQTMYVPFSQAVNGVDEQSKPVFANAIMQIMKRWAELADIDFPEQLAQPMGDSLEKQALQATMEEVMKMQMQMAQMQQQMQPQQGNMQAGPAIAPEQPMGAPTAELPPESPVGL